MHILVTAGNTLAMIDRVRAITNIFTGRTGAAIALEAQRRGHHITLATSHPEVIDSPPTERWHCLTYRTFEDLETLMCGNAPSQDAVIHCAAVADYQAAGIYAPAATTHFDSDLAWRDERELPMLLDRSAGKVKSDEPELWLRLVRNPKLIDKIRSEWGFRGKLVKFKLEVGVGEEALKDIAEASRRASQADWMVANTLEGSSDWALLGNEKGYRKVTRVQLADALLDALEGNHG